MDETHKLGAIVAPICWLVALVGALILYFTLDKDIRSAWAFSYVLGILVGLLNLGLIVKGSKHTIDIGKRDGEHPVKVNMIYFMLRTLVVVAIFTMVIFDQYVTNIEAPKFNVWSTLIGYAVSKIVLLAVMLILKGKVKEV